jgi:hypothetical protein
VERMDAGPKPTWTYLWRASELALVSHVGPAAIHYSIAWQHLFRQQ